MHEHNRHLVWLRVLVAFLFLLAAAIMIVKIRYFGFSLDNHFAFFYQVDARFRFEPTPGRAVRLSLAAPEPSSGFVFDLDTEQNGFFVEPDSAPCRLLHALPSDAGKRSVVCRYRVVPTEARAAPPTTPPPAPNPENGASTVGRVGERLLERLDPGGVLPPPALVPPLLVALGTLAPDEKKYLTPHAGAYGTVDAAVAVLAPRGIPARRVQGIFLDPKRHRQQATPMLEVWHDGAWRAYHPNTGAEGMPDDFLVLQRGDDALYEVHGATGSSLHFTVTRVPVNIDQLNHLRATLQSPVGWLVFSRFSLPASAQNLYRRLSLLPLAILILVVLRNVVGVATMGTFMPVLIAMSFLQTRLLPGLVILTLVLTVGLGIRAGLSRLNLLMVPRISAVVIVVILLLLYVSIGAHALGYSEFVEGAYFPIIILAWTIERASTSWEEDGARNTLKLLAASALAAAVCYLVLSNGYLQYLLYTFFEINLAVLGVILLLGTYTGYRLTELVRFRPLGPS